MKTKIPNNDSPDGFVAVIGVVGAVETAEAATSVVVGHFGFAIREVQPADSPTPPTTKSTVPDPHEVVEAVEVEFGAAVDVVADDRQAVVGSGSCHTAPAEKPVAGKRTIISGRR